MIQKEILKLKKELALSELNLVKLFLKKRDGRAYLVAHSLFVDQILNKLWQALEFKNEASLVACGGYGRQELFPFSDVDLLILIPHLRREKVLGDHIRRCGFINPNSKKS